MKKISRKKISFFISFSLSVYGLSGCGANIILPSTYSGPSLVSTRLVNPVTILSNGIRINKDTDSLKFKITNTGVPVQINKSRHESGGFAAKAALTVDLTIEELSRVKALDNKSQANYAVSFLDPVDGYPIVMVSYNTKGETITGGIQVIKIVNEKAQFLYEITRTDTEFNSLAIYKGAVYAVGDTNFVPPTVPKATVNNEDSRAFLMKITTTGKDNINIQEVIIPGGVGTGVRANELGVYTSSSGYGALSHYDANLNFLGKNDTINFAKDLDLFEFDGKTGLYVLEGGEESTTAGKILSIDSATLQELDKPIMVSGLGAIAAEAKASIEVNLDVKSLKPVALVSSNKGGTRIFDLGGKTEIASYKDPELNDINHAAFIFDNSYVLSATGRIGAVISKYDGTTLTNTGYLSYGDKGPYSTNFLSKINMPAGGKTPSFPYMYAAGLGKYGFALLSIKPKDTIAFSLDSYKIFENGTPNGTVKVTVSRSGFLVGTLKARVSIQNNISLPTTADIATDFSAPFVDVTFAAGETEKTVDIPVIADGIAEGDETFSLLLTTETDNVTGPNVATLTISDS